MATGFGLQDSKSWRLQYPAGNAAGKPVTPSSSLTLSAAWSCVRLLAQTTAILPFMLYRTAKDGTREVAADLPLYELIHDSPNADMTAVEFWEGVVICILLHGNAYAEKKKIGDRVVALEPLRADCMMVKRSNSGAREYWYSDPKGRKVYKEDEILHVKGFGGAGDVGLSTISYARQSMGAALAAEEFAAAVMANGARPSGILTLDQVLTEKQREALKKNIIEPYLGSQNAGGVMIFEAGLKFQAVSMSLDDAQFLQTRGFQVEEICRWFGVPPFMIGHTEKVTSWGSGLEQQNMGFLTYSLMPILKRIEQTVRRSLILPADRGKLTPEFKVDALLRADTKTRMETYVQAVQNGIYKRNEVRGWDNLPPVDGGDELTVQIQNVPLSEANKLPGPAPKKGG